MRPALVIKPNPVTDDSIGMLQGLKPLTMNTLLFQGSDYTLDHPVLLGTVGRDGACQIFCVNGVEGHC